MLLLIPHLFPPAPWLETAMQDLPLPAWQTLLARGRRLACHADGVEAAVCDTFGIPRQQDWPVAPLTLVAAGGVAATDTWLRADPVHLRLLRDRIVLTDPAMLDLSQAEADALADSIGTHFGDAFRPQPLHPARWYLRFAHAPRWNTTPLSLAIGRAIEPLLPQGEDARAIRAQLNELQMLLHAHPVNQAREARGALPVNSLWLWGGGHLPAACATPAPLLANDASARALAVFCGAPLRPLPARLEPALLKTGGVILLDALTPAGQNGDVFGWRDAIRQLETHWFTPLRAALRSLPPDGVHLRDPVNGQSLRLQRADAWKFWRRPRA